MLPVGGVSQRGRAMMAVADSERKLMEEELTKLGITARDNVAWGSHLCHFYQTKDDLVDMVVPYLRAGLEDNELCIWLGAEPLGVEDAWDVLREAVSNLEDYIRRGQLEIIDAREWYLKSGVFDAEEVLRAWREKEELARRRGFAGLRAAGNISWLEDESWDEFIEYEEAINRSIGEGKMLALCCYCLDKCGAVEIARVSASHGLTVTGGRLQWKVWRNPYPGEEQATLLRSEKELRQLLDNFPLGIRIVTGEGKLLYANRAILDIYGYSDFEELEAAPTRVRYTEQSYAEHRERVRSRKAGKPVPPRYEISVVRKNGEVRHLAVHRKETIWNGQRHFLSLYEDITERKVAEEKLRQSEERYRALFNSSVVGTFVIDAETLRVVLVNEAAARAFGFDSVEEALGANPLDFVPPEERDRVLKIIIEDMFEQDLRRLEEFRVFSRDGREMWINAVGARITHEGRMAGLVSFIDISERKRAELQLRQSEEKYRLVCEGVNEAVALFRFPDLRIVYWNQPFADLMKEMIPKNVEDITTADLANVIDAEDWNKALVEQAKAIAGEPVQEADTRLIRARDLQGKRRVFQVKSSLYKEDGRVVADLVALLELTDLMEAHEKLRQSEERYRQLYYGINEAVALFRFPDLKVSYWNKHFEDLYKLLLTKNIEDASISDIASVMEPEDWSRVEKALYEASAGEIVTHALELRFKDREGKRRVFEVRASAYREGGSVTGIQVAMSDVTERKAAEELLRESEEKYHQLCEGITEALAVFKLPGFEVSYWNKRFAEYVKRIYGKPVEELSGAELVGAVAADDWSAAMEALSRTLAGLPVDEVYELKVRDFQGEVHFVEVRPTFFKEKGQVTGIQVMIVDVTERKEAEEQLKQSFINLAETISRAVESSDPYTAGHQRGVAELAYQVGKKLGLDEGRLLGLYIGGLLHDIGKISVPASILSKMGTLTSEEWALICSHTKQGYRILKETNFPWPIADMVLHHHERLDGSGYPDGLDGDQLSLEVRILAVCDVAEAMSSHRPYRPARSKEEIIEELERGRGRIYDAAVVDAVLEVIEKGGFRYWSLSPPPDNGDS